MAISHELVISGIAVLKYDLPESLAWLQSCLFCCFIYLFNIPYLFLRNAGRASKRQKHFKSVYFWYGWQRLCTHSPQSRHFIKKKNYKLSWTNRYGSIAIATPSALTSSPLITSDLLGKLGKLKLPLPFTLQFGKTICIGCVSSQWHHPTTLHMNVSDWIKALITNQWSKR